MRIIVAPDSYKGSVSALEAAEAMERGIRAVFPAAEVIKVPLADGGEGTVAALVTATDGRFLDHQVQGPLGTPVQARWGVLGDGQTAVMEMAAASGLTLVPEKDRDPRLTTTYGTGQLIKAVLDCGLRKIIIGVGGSATNDGGSGMARALGVKFLNAQGGEISPGGSALAQLACIDLTEIDARLGATEITVACDVDNPLCGPRGASAVYGAQKGATAEMISELDAALAHYAQLALLATGRNIAQCPGAGAAGGLAAGLLFFTQAQLRRGIDIVLETTEFSRLVKNADLVITGEGQTDGQTAFGKAPVGVARAAKAGGVPVVCLAGALGPGAENVLVRGIDALMSITAQPMALAECMRQGATLIEAATARLCRLIAVGRSMTER
ncbi:MAG TPA: glycerate kinase [Firmicutes bacterium]|nr:glycerate kinase [Bacillota bacterium]